ncbi:transcriptional regulator [Ktedonosporobacter rubrisoli]|uniref:Transcriptional regulator n=1 Tax=Ktedonosporobacter rubrisoli TaxID=2509675 RepID=A0A4P6K0D9_KTERU|nr:helix-turn-helix domain-containing protein [Ktedonosporobacter rubrisoli]QBD81415.1 transcriptional regulator [Ktedonosporobacter rubrisoli]
MREAVYTRKYSCASEAAADIFGGKWKVLILCYLCEAPRRFNELRRLLPEVTQRMLIRQLRELEQDGIVHREIYGTVPPQVTYSLTELGLGLEPIMEQMIVWGERYLAQDQECLE